MVTLHQNARTVLLTVATFVALHGIEKIFVQYKSLPESDSQTSAINTTKTSFISVLGLAAAPTNVTNPPTLRVATTRNTTSSQSSENTKLPKNTTPVLTTATDEGKSSTSNVSTLTASNSTEAATSISRSTEAPMEDPSTDAPFEHCFFVVSSLFGNMSDVRHNATLQWYQHATVNSIIANANHLEKEYGTNHKVHVEAVLVARDRFATDPVVPHDFPFTRVTKSQIAKYMQQTVNQRQCPALSVVRIDADDAILPGYLDEVLMGYRNKCGQPPRDNCIHLAGAHQVQRFTAFQGTKDNFLHGNFPENAEFHCSLVGGGPARVFLSTGISVSFTVPIWKQFFEGDHTAAFGRHTKMQKILQNKAKGTGARVYTQDISLYSIYTETPLSGHFAGWKHMGRKACDWTKVRNTIHYNHTKEESLLLLKHMLNNVPRLTMAEHMENANKGPKF